MIGLVLVFFFKQKTAYERRISDWSSDVCSSDLGRVQRRVRGVETSVDEGRCLRAAPGAEVVGDHVAQPTAEARLPRGIEDAEGLPFLGPLLREGSAEERRVGKECVSNC